MKGFEMYNYMIIAAAGEELDSSQSAPAQLPQGTDSAQGTETGTQADGANPPADQQDPPMANQLLTYGMLAVAVFLIFMMFRGPKKKQQQHEKMIKSLKKNDKVRTIGGIIGTIIDVRDDVIVLKVDEANNTKMKVVPGAISQTLAEEEKQS